MNMFRNLIRSNMVFCISIVHSLIQKDIRKSARSTSSQVDVDIHAIHSCQKFVTIEIEMDRNFLAVFILYFGALPPWFSFTLHSMALNPQVSFFVIGDAPPPDILPSNVRFQTLSFSSLQARLSVLLIDDDHGDRGSSNDTLQYVSTYKANDVKPFMAYLFPDLLRGHTWWAWADIDVIFGDILKFLNLARVYPACCKTTARRHHHNHNEDLPSAKRVNVYYHKEACPCARDRLFYRVLILTSLFFCCLL